MTTETSSQQSIRKAGPYDRYTDEQKAKLRRMWLEGVVLKQIAFELGKTKGSVKKMRMVLKLPRRRTGDKRHQLRINVNEGIYRKMGLRCSADSRLLTTFACLWSGTLAIGQVKAYNDASAMEVHMFWFWEPYFKFWNIVFGLRPRPMLATVNGRMLDAYKDHQERRSEADPHGTDSR
jgi:hypothetical protein